MTQRAAHPQRIATQAAGRWSLVYRMVLCVALCFGTARASLLDILPDDLTSSAALTTVRPDYRNTLVNTTTLAVNPTAPVATAGTCFSGTFGAYAPPVVVGTTTTMAAVVPTGTYHSKPVHLVASSCGQTFANAIPYDEFEKDFLYLARGLCFGQDGSTSLSAGQAAFRYKSSLYTTEAIPGESQEAVVNRLEARLLNGDNFDAFMATLYGSAEVEKAAEAEALVRYAIRYAPLSQNLADLLLDIYFHRATIQTLIARERLVQAYGLRLDPVPAGFVIDKEITQFLDTVDEYRKASEGYFKLLKDPLAVDIARFQTDTGEPFGLFLFKQFQPSRSLLSASYQSANQEIKPVEPDPNDPNVPAVLVGGFKDLALLLGVFQDEANASVELAQLYALRGNVVNNVAVDVQAAETLLTTELGRTYLRGNMLLAKSEEIPNFDPANLESSGIPEVINGFSSAFAQMTATQQFLEGDTNLLGYQKDFLFLVGDIQGQSGFFDSYDRFNAFLNANAAGNPLGDAVLRFNTALAERDSYKGSLDQLKDQFKQMRERYQTRLAEIIGTFDKTSPKYETGEQNVGSELYLQRQSIEAAKSKIKLNELEQQKVDDDINGQMEKIQITNNVQDAKKSIYVKYANKQAQFSSILGGINAAQAAANEVVDTLDAVGGSSNPALIGPIVGAHSANGVVQALAEVGKGLVDAEKEKLDGLEQADLVDQDGVLLNLDLQDQLGDLIHHKQVLALESVQAAIVLLQEQSKLQALYDEKADAEKRMDEWREDYVTRYHADPVHRLRFTESLLDAEKSFQVAQKWCFYTMRALEYKWNIPFVYTNATGNYSLQSVFRARNTDELRKIFSALQEFNVQAESNRGSDRFDWFSLRKDFLGFGDDIAKFRQFVKQNTDAAGNITLSFNTVTDKNTFYRGPRYAANGQVIDPGLWNDKIQWMKINIPGAHTVANPTVVGTLLYGGSSFLRNQTPGSAPDPQRPDLIVNEARPWATRFWYFDLGGSGVPSAWRFVERQRATVSCSLVQNPQVEVPDSALQITAFAERAVAASNWTLLLFSKESNQTKLNIDEMNDIEIYFYHRAKDRQ